MSSHSLPANFEPETSDRVEPVEPAAVVPAELTVEPLQLLSRERAILEFNRRVLAQARRDDVPLLERLRYICIVSSNLDEFFEVRYADYVEAVRSPHSGLTQRDLLDASSAAHELVREQYALFNDVVMPSLAQAGIVVLHHHGRNAEQRRWVAQFFDKQVRPLLMPIGLDPAHPFPQVANKSLNFIVKLGGTDAYGRDNSIAIVKVPRVLPRVIRMPESISEGKQAFVLLSSVIRGHLEDLFPGRKVESFSQFRVTRDTDLDVDEDDITNLRQALRSMMSTRQFGKAIRLEVVDTCPPELSGFLLQQFGLTEEALYPVDGPVNLVRLGALIDQADAAELRFQTYDAAWPRGLSRQESIFDQLKRGDVMLHHPWESFDPVVEFLRQAVEDPNVLAIRQTIYRTGSESALMELLLEAVRRGKEVMVVVELKARFDEEANINWADRLEALGAQVVYGIVGLKTHAKMLLVTRREGMRLRRYAHLSTGNYNAKTARLYTDVGYLTANVDLTNDVDLVFQELASLTRGKKPSQLLVAPGDLHKRTIELIGKVTQAARKGRTARIVAKINALTDPDLIDALVVASQAGADIDLIVRGACMLPPGLKGQTDRIRVRSVVGRMLEHSRVLYYRWGDGSDDEALYLSSADWMSRNMLRRIEIAWPVRDVAIRQRVIDECLVPYLYDRLDSWMLRPDGRYERIDDDGVSAQQALMQRYAPR